MFFEVKYMTAIPDSFNMSELSNMLENAPQEEDLHATVASNDDKDLTPEQMEEMVEEILRECATPSAVTRCFTK